MESKIYIATFSENAIEVIRKNSVNIELNHLCISENLDSHRTEQTIADMRRDIEDSGARQYIVHGPFTEICPGSIDHRAVEMGLERLEEAYQICRRIHARRMVVHTGYMPLIYYKEWHTARSLEFWHKFMEDKPDDFRLYIENVFEDEPYMLKELIDKIDDPRVSLCLDAGHANVMRARDMAGGAAAAGAESAETAGEAAGLTVEKWIEILGDRISHFHLHNNYGDKDMHNALAEGDMNMDGILEAIGKYCGPDVTMTIESKTCAESAEWLKEKI